MNFAKKFFQSLKEKFITNNDHDEDIDKKFYIANKNISENLLNEFTKWNEFEMSFQSDFFKCLFNYWYFKEENFNEMFRKNSKRIFRLDLTKEYLHININDELVEQKIRLVFAPQSLCSVQLSQNEFENIYLEISNKLFRYDTLKGKNSLDYFNYIKSSLFLNFEDFYLNIIKDKEEVQNEWMWTLFWILFTMNLRRFILSYLLSNDVIKDREFASIFFKDVLIDAINKYWKHEIDFWIVDYHYDNYLLDIIQDLLSFKYGKGLELIEKDFNEKDVIESLMNFSRSLSIKKIKNDIDSEYFISTLLVISRFFQKLDIEPTRNFLTDFWRCIETFFEKWWKITFNLDIDFFNFSKKNYFTLEYFNNWKTIDDYSNELNYNIFWNVCRNLFSINHLNLWNKKSYNRELFEDQILNSEFLNEFFISIYDKWHDHFNEFYFNRLPSWQQMNFLVFWLELQWKINNQENLYLKTELNSFLDWMNKNKVSYSILEDMVNRIKEKWKIKFIEKDLFF